jgi:hypothetical protein
MIICKGFVFILLGLNIYVINDIFREKKARLIFYTIAAIYFSAILLSAIYNPLGERYPWYLRGITTDTEKRFDYLFISNASALLLLFIISRAKNIYIKLIITVFGSFIIVSCLSRASLICFVAASIITITIHCLKGLKAGIKKTVRISALLILLISLSIKYVPLLLDQMKYLDTGISNRFNLYALMNKDGSYLLRKELLNERLLELKETWLFGRYMSEVVEERPGTYMHNWLSFLSAFGIGPFLLSVFLILSASYKIARQFLKDSKSPVNELLFLWSIYMVVIIAFSRAYDYYQIWFILLGIPMINQGLKKKHSHKILVENCK